MAIHAYLKAERDMLNQKEYDAMLAKEKEIMKDRHDWKVGESVYSKRWLPPTKELGKQTKIKKQIKIIVNKNIKQIRKKSDFV